MRFLVRKDTKVSFRSSRVTSGLSGSVSGPGTSTGTVGVAVSVGVVEQSRYRRYRGRTGSTGGGEVRGLTYLGGRGEEGAPGPTPLGV